MKQKGMFNKGMTLVIASLVVMTFLTSCKENTDTVFANKQYDDSGMKTITKSEFDYSNGIVLNTLGFAFTFPQAMMDLRDSENLSYISTRNSVIFMYRSEKVSETVNANSSEEEQMEAVTKGSVPCLAISRISANDENGEAELEQLSSLFPYLDPITTVGEDTYYFAYNDDYSKISPTDGDNSKIEKLLAARESLKNNICLFPADSSEIEKPSSDVNMNSFSAKTLNDDTFTQENLAEYDLTMVNIWTTWCGPCIAEMPELQKLYEVLPDNVNMITICADGDKESELAKQIIEKSGCFFQTLYPNEQLEQALLNEVIAYPTTVFFDRNGNLVGEAELGVPGDNAVEGYLKMIEKRLDNAGAATGVTGK